MIWWISCRTYSACCRLSSTKVLVAGLRMALTHGPSTCLACALARNLVAHLPPRLQTHLQKCNNAEKAGKHQLIPLIKRLSDNVPIPTNSLLERLTFDTLEKAELVQSKDHWVKKERRLMTKAFYTQNKFNLLREENEGYAKLISDLQHCGGWTEESMESVVKNIQSLIGYFFLDPNRVRRSVPHGGSALPCPAFLCPEILSC